MKNILINGLMAVRNLIRNRRRTISTLLAILIGLVGLTFLDGYISYSMWGLKETIIHSGSGHIQGALTEEFFDEGDTDPFPFMIEGYKKIAKEIRKNPAVKDVMAGISIQGLVSLGGKTQAVQIKALPILQASENLSFRSITAGRDLDSEIPGQVLLGQGLAKNLGLNPGQTVTIFSTTQGGGLNNQTYTIAGLITSGIAAYDNVSVFMDLKDAQALIQTEGVPQLFIFLEKTDDTGEVLAQLKSSAPPSAPKSMVFRSWEELSPYFREANSSYQMVLGVARLIVMLVALFSISGTMTLSILERLREVGTLRSFGVKKSGVVGMFLWEGLGLGLIGALVGTALGLILTELVNSLGGITMPAQPGMSHALTIYFKPLIKNFIENALLVFLVAGLGSILPAVAAAFRNTAGLLRSK